ncbi:MAG: hypothetical protein ACT4SY_02020 [Hyphomicrobiales bacterium]
MRLAILAAFGLMAAVNGAAAASLCNCCGTDTAEACAAVCQPVKVPQGQCVAAVDFAGKPAISENVNPLYDVSLRNLRLATTKGAELEAFRRLLEAARRGVEKDRRAALRAYARGKIDQSAGAASIARYESAIVNYYLGLQAYRDAYRRR